MGVYLSKPNTIKESEDGGEFPSTVARFGLSAMQGWRQYMEDAHLAVPSFSCEDAKLPQSGLFAVFDGHGGPAVSSWTSKAFQTTLLKEIVEVKREMDNNVISSKIDVDAGIALLCEALQRTFLRLDEAMQTADSRQELKRLHEQAEEKREMSNNESETEGSSEIRYPDAIIDALFGSSIGGRPMIRLIEQDGQKYYQLFSGEDSTGSPARTQEASSIEDKTNTTEDASKPGCEDDKKSSDSTDGRITEKPDVDSSLSKPETQGDRKDLVPATDASDATETEAPSSKEESDAVSPKGETAAPAFKEEQKAHETGVGPVGDDVQLIVGFDRSSSCHNTAAEKALDAVSEKLQDAGEDTPSPKLVESLMGSELAKAEGATVPKSPVVTTGMQASAAETSLSPVNGEDENAVKESPAGADMALLPGLDDADASQPYQPECCGSTAIVALVIGGDHPVLITANAGDSRAVLCRGGRAIPLSLDHKPELPSERRRIYEAGGRVVNGRVDGNLNLSRALGDLIYKKDVNLPPEKQKITSLPDVRIVELCEDDQFVILACDGIWDCLSNQDAVEFVLERLNHDGDRTTRLSEICEQMCDFCLSENPLASEGGIGCDNMTVMIVELGNAARSKGIVDGITSFEGAVKYYGTEPDNFYDVSVIPMSDDEGDEGHEGDEEENEEHGEAYEEDVLMEHHEKQK